MEAARRAAPAAFALAMFLSAALIFALQPMFARLATPLLGGSPAVWNTSMAFFQAALLAGYLYAHLLQRVRDVRDQAAIHALVLFAGLLVLPVHVSQLFGPPNSAHPSAWLLGVLTVSIGAPFAAASATAPLLQAWYARTGRPDAHDPYYLYAASNAGSLIGLLLYPIAIEPSLGAAQQSLAWTQSYAVAAALIVACGLVTFAASGETDEQKAEAPAASAPPAWRQRLYWLAAAALPASLLLGVTQHIVTDVASAPFLWAAPLALYLVTFIIAFMRGGLRVTPVVLIAHPLAIVALAVTQILGNSWLVALGAHLAAFFASALVCHLALARTRPASDRLTEFYFWVSLGGVVGGAATALLAPVIFNGIYEYPLALAAIALFRPLGATLLPKLSSVLAAAAFTMAGAVAVTAFRAPEMTVLFGGGVGAAAALMAAALPTRMGAMPPLYRIGFIGCALAFAALMTYVSLRPDHFVLQYMAAGDERIALARVLKLAALIFGFLTFAFVAHSALQEEERPQLPAVAALGVAAPLVLMAVVFAANEDVIDARAIVVAGLGFAAIALFVCRNRPRVFAALILALFAIAFIDDVRGAHVLRQERSFFGVLRVEEVRGRENALRILMHGTTIHGAQLTGAGASRRPLTYYNPETALGEATLAGLSGGQSSSLALVGLGTGATSCLTRPRDRLTIYEIDPTVVRLSGPRGSVFTYVAQCQPHARIVLGDARLGLARAPDGAYDVIVLDAFSSDAIPAHLLTRDAVRMYMRKLSRRGVLVLHLSNRNLALVREAARVTHSLNLPHLWRVSDRVDDPIAGPYGGLPASAMIVAANDKILNDLPLISRDWREIERPRGRPWTDDYVNLPRALWEGWRGAD